MGKLDSLLGKKVVVQYNTGIKKYGTLVSFDTVFIAVKFADGENHNIPIVSVADVYPDPMA